MSGFWVGAEFGLGFALGFSLAELVMQEVLHRIWMYRTYGVWRWTKSRRQQ